MAAAKRIAILPSNRPSFKVMAALADYFHTQTDLDPFLVTGQEKIKGYLGELTSVEVFLLGERPPAPKAVAPPPPHPPKSPSRIKKVYRLLPRRLRDLPHRLRAVWRPYWAKTILHDYQREKARFRGYLQQADTLFKQQAPLALVCISDRHGNYELAIVEAAYRRNIPIIAFPHALSYPAAIASKRVGVAEYDQNAAGYGWLKRYIRWRYPGQWFAVAGTSVLYYPPLLTLVFAALELLPAQPWVIGGGRAWRVCLPGEETRQNYINWGIAAHKLVVTGMVEHDELYEAHQQRASTRAKLAARYGFSEHDKVIIYAVPPLAEHYGDHAERYWAGIETVLAVLQQTGAAVLVSLHPKSDPAQYAERCQRYGAVLLGERLRDVLPIADVMVNNYSSTVDWGVLLRMPTIIADFSLPEGVSFPDFHQPALWIAESAAALQQYLHDIFSQTPRYQDYMQKQAVVVAAKAPFDGRAKQNLYDLVSSLAPHVS